jgi:type I restriction enzyme S subunit
MGVEKGLKKTESGIIPDSWSLKELSEVSEFFNGKGHEKCIDESGEYIVVNSKFISTEGDVKKSSRLNLSPLLKNDITIVMSDIPNGKALAKCFLVDKDNTYTLNQRIGCVRPRNGDSKYFLYQLNRNKYFLSFDTGTGQTNLRKSEVLSCPVFIPEEVSEQVAIATALSNTDGLISSLEKIISKKRNIRKGTIQQLLQSKTGYQVKKLGDIAFVIGGGTPSTLNATYWNGEINWFTPTEVGVSKYISKSVRKITSKGFQSSSARMLPVGTILLTTRAGIGDCSILMKEGCTNQGFQSLVPKKGIDNEFLYYLVLTLKETLLQNASGSTFLEISPSKIKQIEVSIPDFLEQKRISTILSDMDIEIVVLESKLVKYRWIKQGMMQQLLTGKIRLV